MSKNRQCDIRILESMATRVIKKLPGAELGMKLLKEFP
jgi:hypothetical protein